ncbi:MAG: succinylglutamate desuccinylase/aspartoacylase family protein [Burkholderiaceae bacterium]
MNPTSLRSHAFHGFEPGPRLIVLGAVHGNETCGTRAIERMLGELDAGALRIARGCVTFVPVTNPLAYAHADRAGDRNLNRRLRPNPAPRDFEDRIANVLCPLLAAHDALLDLHSFHTAGEPFAMIGPLDNPGPLETFARAAEEEALALRLGPRRLVEGWLDAYAAGVANRLRRVHTSDAVLDADPAYGVGTTEYMRSCGGIAITLECGQHADPLAPQIGYAAIRNTLAHLGLVDDPAPVPRTDVQLLRLQDVTDRDAEDDAFERAWASFDPVAAGTVIARRADGQMLRAPSDGFIVFPNPAAAPGSEWFYFARASGRVLRG